MMSWIAVNRSGKLRLGEDELLSLLLRAKQAQLLLGRRTQVFGARAFRPYDEFGFWTLFLMNSSTIRHKASN